MRPIKLIVLSGFRGTERLVERQTNGRNDNVQSSGGFCRYGKLYDKTEVPAALKQKWNNGPVESHGNQLKEINCKFADATI